MRIIQVVSNQLRHWIRRSVSWFFISIRQSMLFRYLTCFSWFTTSKQSEDSTPCILDTTVIKECDNEINFTMTSIVKFWTEIMYAKWLRFPPDAGFVISVTLRLFTSAIFLCTLACNPLSQKSRQFNSTSKFNAIRRIACKDDVIFSRDSVVCCLSIPMVSVIMLADFI